MTIAYVLKIMRCPVLLFCGQAQGPSSVEQFVTEMASGTCKVLYSSSVESRCLEKLQNSTLLLNGFIWEIGKLNKNYLELIPWT